MRIERGERRRPADVGDPRSERYVGRDLVDRPIGDAQENEVGVFLGIGISLLTLYVGLLGARWAKRKLEPPKLPEGHELDQIQERLARLEECEIRLAEVEERLDFTERMLAQSRPEALLPPAEGR